MSRKRQIAEWYSLAFGGASVLASRLVGSLAPPNSETQIALAIAGRGVHIAGTIYG
ncbi:MAG: hypothetical protein ABSC01_01170 [Verrucomicrobiota bacterium]